MPAIQPVTTEHPLMHGNPPAWANGWGHDTYGPFVEILVGKVRQRLRWIPPGQFRMGSPPSEHEGFKNEGPQHWVTLTDGFWLFDTPCRQEMWRELMGDNPSQFQSPTRPVEHVSWDDANQFIDKLRERVGAHFSLPAEAQWEYACRAETESATYAGDLEVLGDANAPRLHEIAWYAGNSGFDFELDNGVDLKDYFSNRQFEDDPSGTHPVAEKVPNRWGLYDMLADVWEWCADCTMEDGTLLRYPDAARTNPLCVSGAADRVVRGGSWGGSARYVRAAARYWFPRGHRSNGVGFRCAQFSPDERGTDGEKATEEPRSRE